MGVYEDLGVTPIINATGSVTRLGGAPLAPAALEAFQRAAAETAPMEQLQAAASKRLSALTGTEAALVTGGAAAALTMGAAAILARFDLARMERLPDTSGMPNEFVIAREHRNGYDHAVRAAGARLVEVGFNEVVANAGVRRAEAWEYEAAFSDKTAGVFFVFSPGAHDLLKQVVERAHRRNLPVLVDAAAEVPPKANLAAIPATGADLVCFSGGKAIRGPQSTGILCGKRDLIASAALQTLDMDDHLELWDPSAAFIDRSKLAGMPRHGIGRSFKVSKEEILALVAAAEWFAAGGHQTLIPDAEKVVQTVAAALEGLPGERRVHPSDGESLPILEITVDDAALRRDAFDVCRRLRRGQPPIYLGHGRLADGILVLNPLAVSAGQANVLATRLREELAAS